MKQPTPTIEDVLPENWEKDELLKMTTFEGDNILNLRI